MKRPVRCLACGDVLCDRILALRVDWCDWCARLIIRNAREFLPYGK